MHLSPFPTATASIRRALSMTCPRGRKMFTKSAVAAATTGTVEGCSRIFVSGLREAIRGGATLKAKQSCAAMMAEGPFWSFGGIEQFSQPRNRTFVILRESLEREGKHLPSLKGRAIDLALARLIGPAGHGLIAPFPGAAPQSE